MGVSIIILGFLGLIFILSIILPIRIMKKRGKGLRPYMFSILVFGLLILNSVLYLSSFYATLPVQVADFLFMPIWIILWLLNGIAALMELKHNIAFAIVLIGFTLINFIFILFTWGIGQM